jgi:predicted DNA-binding transcriptional regulator AlpA
MPANPPLKLQDSPTPQQDALLIGAEAAAPLCARSEASWWRDHAAGRIPAPIKRGGRTLWRVQELRDWVEAGCPARKIWEAQRRQIGGGR